MSMVTANVLLMGAGWFGKNHLRVLLALEKQKKIHLVGVVETSKELRKKIKQEHGLPVFDDIDVDLLKRVDAVDIVTNTNTHFQLAKKCLRYADVFVEKPLAETVSRARELQRLSKEYGRVLMVGHIFRFHPITRALKSTLRSKSSRPYYIKGEFVSPFNTWKKGKTAALDNLHLFDILDYIFGETPAVIAGRARSRVTTAELHYPSGMHAVLELGWRGEEKERILDFYFQDKIIHCDFGRNFIEERGGGKKYYELKVTPLEMELATFLKAIKKQSVRYADGDVGARIVSIASRVDATAKREARTT